MTLKTKPKAILFDMDGTLCDSIHAVHQCLNTLLQTHNRPLLSKHVFRGHMDKGSQEMISMAFQLDRNDPQVEPLQQQLLQTYLKNMAEQTVFFPGIEKVLTYINQQNIAWGIVTNRPAFLMAPLLTKFNLPQRASCLVYGDTLPTCKPEPDMLLHACKRLNISPTQALYVGDTEGDMIAAKRAGVPCVFAEYGYLRAESKPETLEFTSRIQQAHELIDLLEQVNPEHTI